MSQRRRLVVTRLSCALLLGLAAACDSGITGSVGIPELEPARLDFQKVRLGETRRLQTKLRNKGRGSFRIESVRPENMGAFVASSLPEELESNGEVVVSVLFSPLEAGILDARLVIITDSSEAPEVVLELAGAGVETNFAVSPERLDFGILEVHGRATLPLTIRNEGLLPETALFELGEGGSVFELDPTLPSPLTVQAGAELSLPITYAPIRAGTDQSSLILQPCETCPETIVAIVGKAVDSFVDVQPPDCVDFGAATPGNTVTRTVTVRNLGLRALEVSAAAVTAGESMFSVAATVLPQALGNEERVELTLTYAPTAFTDDQGTLLVSTDDPSRSTVSLCLEGTGGGPEIVASPNPLGFGTVATNVPKTRILRVGNVGTTALEVISAEIVASPEFTVTLPIERVAAPSDYLGPVLVTYTPTDDGPDTATLRLRSNDPDNDPLEITLLGHGRVLPPCELEVIPGEPLAFGNVTKNRTSTLNVQIRNVTDSEGGTADCLISRLELEPGSSPYFTLVDGPVEELVMAAGDTRRIPVQFKPLLHGRFTASLSFEVSDPANPRRAIPVTGMSEDGCIFLSPDELDFGTVGANCTTRDREVTLYSSCTTGQVTVSRIVLSAGADQPFVVGSVPPLPASVSGAEALRFRARYAPTANGEHTGAILVYTSERPEPYNVGLRGRAAEDAVQRDSFFQERVPTVDLLFVIDNSGSMGDEQDALAANFGNFMQFATQQQVDYRIAVTTTDVGTEAGRFVPVGGQPRWLTPQTPNISQLFAQRINQGTNGSPDEQGLEAFRLALSPPASLQDNLNFVRPDAFLSIVVVSDEEDSSPNGTPYYYNFLLQLKNGRRNLFSQSCVANPGTRYETLQVLTGGKFSDISLPDWSASLRAFGAEAFGYKTRFYLTSRPVPGTLEVRIDGQLVTPTEGETGSIRNYWYRAEDNMLEFSPLAIPEPGQTLEATYVVECSQAP